MDPSFFPRMLLAASMVVLVVAGCAGVDEADLAPDERYGHRSPDRSPEGPELLQMSSPPAGEDYFLYPLPVGTITVRKGAGQAHEQGDEEDEGVPVDILVTGALPDACVALHDVSQSRSGRFLDVEISVRRLRGDACRPMRRPYRLYVDLEWHLQEGSYILRINGDPHPFEIHEQ